MKTKPTTVKITPAQAAGWRPPKAQRQVMSHLRTEARKLDAAAASAPLPGPLREAFASFPRVILGLALVPVCAGHIAVLTQVNSPFLQAIRLGGQRARARTAPEKKRIETLAAACVATLEHKIEVLFIFTRTYPELRAILARGPEAWADALAGFMVTLPPLADWDAVETALGLWHAASHATFLQFETRKDDRKISFPPTAPAETAWVG